MISPYVLLTSLLEYLPTSDGFELKLFGLVWHSGEAQNNGAVYEGLRRGERIKAKRQASQPARAKDFLSSSMMIPRSAGCGPALEMGVRILCYTTSGSPNSCIILLQNFDKGVRT